jgi:sulfatase modifying factor 1
MAWGFKAKGAGDTPVDQVMPLEGLLRRWAREEPHNRIAVNAKDGSILVYVPPGEFEMGDGRDGDCPKHRVALSGYWIGVYAVSNAQYARFVAATGYEHVGSSASGQGNHPVVEVSWDDATVYAEWAGCELASEAQWERAVRGPLGSDLPLGR